MKTKISTRIFEAINGFFLILISLSVILPFVHIFSLSVSNASAVNAQQVGLVPIGFNLTPYTDLIQKPVFLDAFTNTVWLTVANAVLSLIVNSSCAYGLSKYFFGKKVVTYIFVITMYFGGGLIPTYMLMTNTLHLYNNFLAYLLPSIVNVFYMIVIRTQIESLPPSLSEAAEIDGANEFQIFAKIVLPSIVPTLAAVGMFFALNMWNMWYSVLLYTNKKEMWTLQYLLRSIVLEKTMETTLGNVTGALMQGGLDVSSYNYQMAAIIATALPIICIYPFVQKYFVKGILTGSVKG